MEGHHQAKVPLSCKIKWRMTGHIEGELVKEKEPQRETKRAGTRVREGKQDCSWTNAAYSTSKSEWLASNCLIGDKPNS